MSLGPEKIILILVVALIVFGPQRLPDIARQVGAAMRELRRMQDTVRGELEHVLRPDFSPTGANPEPVSIEDTDHAALPPGAASDMSPDMAPHMGPQPGTEMSAGPSVAASADMFGVDATEAATEAVTDDGFAGPRSFS